MNQVNLSNRNQTIGDIFRRDEQDKDNLNEQNLQWQIDTNEWQTKRIESLTCITHDVYMQSI